MLVELDVLIKTTRKSSSKISNTSNFDLKPKIQFYLRNHLSWLQHLTGIGTWVDSNGTYNTKERDRGQHHLKADHRGFESRLVPAEPTKI